MTNLCATCTAHQLYPKLVEVVANLTHTTPAKITKLGRTETEAVRAREVIAYTFRAAGLGQSLTGQVMNLDPSTVFHMLRRIESDPATLAIATQVSASYAATPVSA